MFPPHNGSPFWARFTKYRALDTQAANGPSRSSNPVTGGPACSVMSPGTSESCSVCAQSKTPRHLPVGKLVPLPIPQRPWLHIGIEFETNSKGKTCVFVTVDRFSKACKLVPLSGLPTALEAAEILHQQFISRVWKALVRLLGVTVNLSSGYHPQTNGQTERKIQELGRYLWGYCNRDQHSWSRFFPWAEYALNSIGLHTLPVHASATFPWSGELSEAPAVDYWF